MTAPKITKKATLAIEVAARKRFAARKRMERIGRDCVRELASGDGVYVLVEGSLPRRGFPKGSLVRTKADGQQERLHDPNVLLKAVQVWMRDNGDAA